MYVTIVGCGTVGSTLAYCLSVKTQTLEQKGSIKLIDCDLLLESNLPYLHLDGPASKPYLKQPKCCVLQKLIQPLTNWTIMSEMMLFTNDYQKEENEVIVDCRDTNSVTDLAYIKATLDGPFGIMVFNPPKDDTVVQIPKDYLLKNNKFYGLKFANLICDYLLDDEKKTSTCVVFAQLDTKEIKLNEL